MRIDRLDLTAYGPFTGATLDLSGGARGLHVIHGPNEAGKSTALRGLRALLFGVPHRCDDAFLHAYDAIRIGAVLRDEDGGVLEIIRRKAAKRTLRAADDDAEVDPTILENRFLGNITADLFDKMFALDHASLSAGGAAALRAGGELSSILFGSGLDLAELRAYQKRLDAEVDSLFKPSGQNPRINAAIRGIEDKRKEIDAASLKGSVWSDGVGELDELRRRREAVDRDWKRVAAERERLRRVQLALPDLAVRDALLADLATLADAPRLSDDFPDRRRRADRRRDDATVARRIASDDLERLRTELVALPAPALILDDAEVVEAVQAEVGEERRSAHLRVTQVRKRAKHLEEARELASEMGREGEFAPGAIPRLPKGLKSRLQHAHQNHIAYAFEHESARGEIESARKSLAALRLEDRDRPAPRDPAGLKRAIARIQALGDSSDARDGSARELAKLERQASLLRGKLGLGDATPEQIAGLPVPAREVLERLRDAIAAAEAASEAAAREYDVVEDNLLNLVQIIERRKRESDAPGDDALDQGRADRDAAWRRVKADWPAAATGVLIDAFEAASRDADLVADRLRHSSDEVAARARDLADKAHLIETLGSRKRRKDEAAAALDAVRTSWTALLAPLEIAARTPREMIDWADHHAFSIEKSEAIAEVRGKIAAVDAGRSAGVSELHREIAALGEAVMPGESLASARERAAAVLDAIREEANRNAQAASSRAQAARSLEKATAALAESESQLAAWRESWASMLEPLGLAPDAPPEHALAVLDSMTDLAKSLDEAEKLATEIGDGERESALFAARLSDLARAHAPSVASAPTEAVAKMLMVSLRAAREIESSRSKLAKDREDQARAIRAADLDLEASSLALAALAHEAGASIDDDLGAIERRALDRAGRELELHAVEGRLTVLASGAGIDALIDEARGSSAIDLDSNLIQLDEQFQAMSGDRDALGERIGEKANELRMMEETAREARADRAVADREHLLATLETDVERYVHLRLSLAVLRGAIEEFREKNQAPVLRRASEHFAKLTLGSFAGLRADLDDKDEPVLQGVRPDGSTRLGVGGMSVGTTDQLYLAMKLASLEHTIQTRPPLPLVVDDLLIQFDDDRAAAALGCLAELSRKTQVLFFTHHDHLVELARSRLPADTLFIHRLGRRSG